MEFWHIIAGQLPFEWAQYDFMKDALLAVLFVSPIFAFLGCMVINNQMAFFSDALGHATLTGIAIGVIAGLNDPTWAMIIFAVLLSFVITLFRKYSAVSTDAIVGLVMAFTVALGIVVLSKYGGFNKYSKFLIGDILTITTAEIMRLVIVFVFVTVTWAILFNRLLLVSLSRSLAQSRGIKTWTVELVFSVTVALVVTICVQWVGLLVINSLLILPAAASRNIAGNVMQYTVFALIFSLVSGVFGLILSFYMGTATGGTIVLVATAFFIFSFLAGVRKR